MSAYARLPATMDTVTQALLGATVGQACFGHRLGRRAALWGALGGVVPDLDMAAVALAGPLAEFRYHRGLTHALWFGPVVGPLLGYAAWRWQAAARRREVASGRLPVANGPPHRGDKALLGTWMTLMVLALFTHPLLDVFTTYGTQLLAPFSHRRFAVDGVAIIDFLYSGALAAALVVGSRAGPRLSRGAAIAALILTTGYLFYGVRLNARAESEVARQLAAEGTSAASIRCYPTLFQPWLRRAVVRLPGEVRVGLLSLWEPRLVEWRRFSPPEHVLVDQLRETEEGRLFEWFAMGQTAARVRPVAGGHVVEIEDLRYGFWGPPDQGIWGIRATFDERGRLQGGIERFNRQPQEGVGSLVQRIWRATFALELEEARSGLGVAGS